MINKSKALFLSADSTFSRRDFICDIAGENIANRIKSSEYYKLHQNQQ